MQRVARITVSLREPDHSFPWQSASHNKAVGTGFFYNGPNNENWLVTCAHVVESAYDIRFFYNQQEYEADLVFACPDLDIAVIEPKNKKEAENLPSFKNGTSSSLEDLEVNTSVIAIGFPLANEQVITSNGIISGSHDYLIQTTAAINSGNSGGPLIQKHKGLIIGINSAKSVGGFFDSIDNIGYSIPIALLDQCINMYVQSEAISPCKLSFSPTSGIQFVRSTPEIRECYSNCEYEGCLVSSVSHPQLSDFLSPKDVILSFSDGEDEHKVYGKHLKIDKVWIGQEIDLKTYLILFAFNRQTKITYWSESESKKKHHTIDILKPYEPKIQRLYFFRNIDWLDYWVVSGLVLVDLVQNMRRYYYNSNMWKLLTQQDGEERQRVIISAIMPSSLVDDMKCVKVHDAIEKINGKRIDTLKDVEDALANVSGPCIEIETFPYSMLIIPIEQWKKDDKRFAELFGYPANKTLSNSTKSSSTKRKTKREEKPDSTEVVTIRLG